MARRRVEGEGGRIVSLAEQQASRIEGGRDLERHLGNEQLLLLQAGP